VTTFYDPSGDRWGLPTYPFKFAPEGLATIRQLKAQGLRPGGQDPVAQIMWRGGRRFGLLYRVALAKPKRTAGPAQLAAIAKANRARSTCPECHDVKPYIIPPSLGVCIDCHEGDIQL
jgi:hypothetical protein